MEEAGMPSESGEPAGAPASETTAQAPQLRRQSVGIRFAATVIDVGVLSIISWFFVAIAIGAAFSTAAPIAPASQGNINATIAQVNSTVQQVSGALSAGLATAAVITLIIWFLYYTILEGRYGQTLGKYFCKIKVVTEDGASITYTQAAIRTIFRIIDGIVYYLIGAILIWTSEKRQRLGDRLAHTVVIQLCSGE
ncbi:MAG: RDD family protein [Halobacteriota archaeon]